MGQNESIPSLTPTTPEQKQEAPILHSAPNAADGAPVEKKKEINIPKEEPDEKGKEEGVKKIPKVKPTKLKKNPEEQKEKKIPKQQKEKRIPKDQVKTEEVDEKADDAVSVTSSTSNDDKASKKSRRGSWEYVPAGPKVVYPKKSDSKSRELAKLAMDIVDSQHDCTKAPDEWYTGSEFDVGEPLSMADRIKNNGRTRVVPSVAHSETKQEINKKKRQTRKRKSSESSKINEVVKTMESGANLNRSQTPVDQGDIPLDYSLNVSHDMDDMRSESMGSHLSEDDNAVGAVSGELMSHVRKRVDEKPDDAVSVTSSTSNDDKASKKSRRGSWEYVPAGPKVVYPKKSDSKSRELAKLAMDIVDSQHDCTKAPDEWYTGSEFDMKEQLSMGDRIKNNRRTRVVPSIANSEAKQENKKKKRQTRKKESSDSSKTNEVMETMESGSNLSRSETPVDQGDSPLDHSLSHGMDDMLSEAMGSHLSEDYNSFGALSGDLLLNHDDHSMGLMSPLLAPIPSLELFSESLLQPQNGRTSTSPTTYSFLPRADVFPTELPDEILEEP